MGLLDEAIREHLELKRRRGADSGEIAQQEREAFGAGPVVPEPLEAHEPELPHLHAALDEPGEFAAAEPEFEQPPEPLAHVDEPTQLHQEPAVHHLHDAELETEPPRPHGDPADEFPHLAEPVRDEPEPPDTLSQPTREFDLDEVRAATSPEPEAVPADAEPAVEEEPEDVLEETPEFLQETPEHDRLWFEQRPPRDFDF